LFSFYPYPPYCVTINGILPEYPTPSFLVVTLKKCIPIPAPPEFQFNVEVVDSKTPSIYHFQSVPPAKVAVIDK